MYDRDDSRVWKAIDWKVNVAEMFDIESRLTDEDFKTHPKTILNPTQVDTDRPGLYTDITVPIFDDPITVHKVEHQIRKLKRDKAC